MRPFVISILSGIFGIFIGALGLLSNFKFYLQQNNLGMGDKLNSYSMGNDGLILSEILFTLGFSVLILFLFIIRENEKIRMYSITSGILRLIFLIGTISFFWNPGWYFLLDPAGTHTYSYILVLCAFIQAISLFSVKRLQTNGRNVV